MPMQLCLQNDQTEREHLEGNKLLDILPIVPVQLATDSYTNGVNDGYSWGLQLRESAEQRDIIIDQYFSMEMNLPGFIAFLCEW